MLVTISLELQSAGRISISNMEDLEISVSDGMFYADREFQSIQEASDYLRNVDSSIDYDNPAEDKQVIHDFFYNAIYNFLLADTEDSSYYGEVDSDEFLGSQMNISLED
jgi:hypothetical protein